MQTITKKKAFTLIEMLIVIVIIGILAAALIPRLMGAKSKANDTARKANLRQLSAAVNAYTIDNGAIPNVIGTGGALFPYLSGLMNGAIPSDPVSNQFNGGIYNIATGQFAYTPVKDYGILSGGFVLMAAVENPGAANYVVTGTAGAIAISGITEGSTISTCATVTVNTAGPRAACTATDASQLRYIIINPN